MEVAQLENVWLEIKTEALSSSDRLSRVYRALGETALGIRASYILLEDCYELLIEIPNDWETDNKLPEWRGLKLKVIDSPFPSHEVKHISLALIDNESWNIFLYFAADLVTSLEGIENASTRIGFVVECIERWNNFFHRCGSVGLSETSQRGLWAEIHWLEELMDFGFDPNAAVISWKGCRRAYYDFDFSGEVVEVKSTISKEPRRIWKLIVSFYLGFILHT